MVSNTTKDIGNKHNSDIRDKYNGDIRENREILSHFIRVVCFFGRQGLVFSSHNENGGSSNRENFMKYISEIMQYDKTDKDDMKIPVFRAISPRNSDSLDFKCEHGNVL